MNDKKRLIDFYKYYKVKNNSNSLGIVLTNLMELKIEGAFKKGIDEDVKNEFNTILDDLYQINDLKLDEVFFKFDHDKVTTNEMISKLAGKE